MAKKEKAVKTNAKRVLDKNKVAYPVSISMDHLFAVVYLVIMVDLLMMKSVYVSY